MYLVLRQDQEQSNECEVQEASNRFDHLVGPCRPQERVSRWGSRHQKSRRSYRCRYWCGPNNVVKGLPVGPILRCSEELQVPCSGSA